MKSKIPFLHYKPSFPDLPEPHSPAETLKFLPYFSRIFYVHSNFSHSSPYSPTKVFSGIWHQSTSFARKALLVFALLASSVFYYPLKIVTYSEKSSVTSLLTQKSHHHHHSLTQHSLLTTVHP